MPVHRLVGLLASFFVLAPALAIATPRSSATVSRYDVQQIVGHYRFGAKGGFVWTGPRQPTYLRTPPPSLGALPTVPLGDISGFYLSHDSTQGQLHIDQKNKKVYLSTQGTKSVPGDVVPTRVKYFELNRSQASKALRLYRALNAASPQ